MEMRRRDVDPDDSEVAGRVRADDGAARGRAIGQVHRDGVGIGDHMVVGDDGAVPIDLESASERRLGLRLALAREDALAARDRHPHRDLDDAARGPACHLCPAGRGRGRRGDGRYGDRDRGGRSWTRAAIVVQRDDRAADEPREQARHCHDANNVRRDVEGRDGSSPVVSSVPGLSFSCPDGIERSRLAKSDIANRHAGRGSPASATPRSRLRETPHIRGEPRVVSRSRGVANPDAAAVRRSRYWPVWTTLPTGTSSWRSTAPASRRRPSSTRSSSPGCRTRASTCSPSPRSRRRCTGVA